MDTKQIIEVNGVKLEVDLRTARRIEELQVGSRVKVLDSTGYSGAQVYPGIIVGFEPFKELPTIIVAYVKAEYNDVGLKTISYNAKTEKVEIVASIDDDFSVSKKEVLGWFDREEQKARNTLAEIAAKREFFLDRFKAYWRDEPLVDAMTKDGLATA
ncbi:hypothetical protein ACFSTI_24945 [Rhizorhabdus histidinilytica]|uniref:Uncharacterized protein n=1 Tax=Rhizorhabdus histidinilytica TaxID=439228 RepID=A0A1T5A8Q6_9SPHN|nr:hypothetical protein [Rhizorhabdus histidinilytica]SKB31306.1 hypothetical protein SAMN06295920_101707 [Rhizorhabdus histidinilytica]